MWRRRTYRRPEGIATYGMPPELVATLSRTYTRRTLPSPRRGIHRAYEHQGTTRGKSRRRLQDRTRSRWRRHEPGFRRARPGARSARRRQDPLADARERTADTALRA